MSIVIRVTPDERRELQRVAAENQTSVSGFVREAVDEAVADYRETRVFRQK